MSPARELALRRMTRIELAKQVEAFKIDPAALETVWKVCGTKEDLDITHDEISRVAKWLVKEGTLG